MRNTSLEQIVAGNFIKYENLAPLINHAYKGSSATRINLFIDMYSCITGLYMGNYIMPKNYKTLTSCIINMCAHYRHFFRHYLNVETDIYIVMGNNIQTNNHVMMKGWNYGQEKRMKENEFVTRMIEDNVSLLGELCPYIPDCHFVLTSNYESGSVIATVIEQVADKIPNVIVSRDSYLFQLPSMYPDTCVLRPKKFEGKDMSYAVGPFKDMYDIVMFWNIYNQKKSETEYIDPVNLPMLFALNGCKDRCIKSLCRIDVAKRYIINAVGCGAIKCSVDTLYKVNPNMEESVPRALMIQRYHAFDLEFQKSIYSSSYEWLIASGNVAKSIKDPDAVRDINGQYFYDCPLDLDRL